MTGYARGLALVVICSAAGYLGPLVFLGKGPSLSYLGTAMMAAAGAGALLSLIEMGAHRVPSALQGLAGAGAAVLTWMPATLIATFQIIPNLLSGSFQPFDIVWLGAGLGPPFVLAAVFLRAGGPPLGPGRLRAAMQALYRLSVPLLGILLTARALTPIKDHRWLVLFTGVLFLTVKLVLRLRTQEEADHAALD